jgi:hypothetical protein
MINYITTLSQTNNYKKKTWEKMSIPLFNGLIFVLNVIYVILLYFFFKKDNNIPALQCQFFLF